MLLSAILTLNRKVLTTFTRVTAKPFRRVTKSENNAAASAGTTAIPEISDGTGDGLSEPYGRELIDIRALQLHGGVNVSVKRDLDAGVPQYFTERLHLKAHLDAAGGKGVTKRMKVDMSQPALLYIPRKPVLQGTRLHIALTPGQNIGLRLCPHELNA